MRATLIAAAAGMIACLGSVTPLACAIDSDCGPAAFCSAGSCYQGTRTCPLLQPTFSSINHSYFQVGCGVRQRNCHAADSAVIDSGPSFAGDVYRALVNAPAANRLGSARGLILVKPGDPQNSFLLTKLRLTSSADPQFGSGQPAEAPGSTCAAALSTIEQWIQEGAPND
ncbi:MAG TPA: hypothetical protein VF993_00475 [Myxococcales bacterium]